jgi:hypothetical protein
MKYYCLHHSPCVDRKNYLIKFFDKHSLQVEWIEEFLPDSIEVISHKIVHSPNAADRTGKLNRGEISLLFKHSLAIKKIQEINDYGIIFEDDIQDVDFNFNDVIIEFIKLMEKDNIDILWIGSSKNHYKDLPASNYPYIYSNNKTLNRLSHCYMLHSKVADKVYNDYIDFKNPSDLQWDYIIKKFNLKSAWSYPHIYQRTDIKQIPSLLR